MIDESDLSKQLEKELEEVKRRIQILNMIEERLFAMRELAQSVIDNDLHQVEIERINQQIKYLQEQVDLLNSETTQLS
jgi:prefoldin subunit 5